MQNGRIRVVLGYFIPHLYSRTLISLLICKVHTKRENFGSWKSGPRKATSGYLFCTTPNKLELHGDFMEYLRNIGANTYQRGPTRWAQPTWAR